MMTMATMVVSLHKTHSEIRVKSHIAGAFFYFFIFFSSFFFSFFFSLSSFECLSCFCFDCACYADAPLKNNNNNI